MPRCSLAFIYTAAHVAVDVTHASVAWQYKSKRHPVLPPTFLESHPERQSRISPQIGISMRENHSGGKTQINKCFLLDLVSSVLDTQAKISCKYRTRACTITFAPADEHNYMHPLQHVCSAMDSLELKLMFMNAQTLCICVVLFVKLVNWPSFRCSLKSTDCLITQK